ncbi:cupin domain-containing protein [Sphingomonas sp. QA11]|uniref:cupin domain-containing protein n=1 Tax=Sphingomonas sp. QA11 TaxID=2950605 RepID=UPI0023498B11|nr:cupin domain-containing protein [Sphingomonas sp. QA11]WCM28709.1 cupin domain-containing protein [Sphingomonas sp. QA11]
MITDLQSLIAPNPLSSLADAIAEEHRLHLHSARQADFASLLPWPAFNALITLERLQNGQVRTIRNGHDMPPAMLTTRSSSSGVQELAPDTLQSLADKGLSLVINDIERLVPGISALAAMIERHLRARASVNAYVSFRRDSAFGAHWDDHDVMVLQVHGRKRWFCYGQRDRYPIRGVTAFAKIGASEQPEWSAMLEPGDILYIPRGDIHRAQVEEGHSLHLTIGIAYPRGGDVVQWIGRRCLEEELFRRDISALPGREALATRQNDLRAALHRLVDTIDLDDFLAMADRQRESLKALNLGLSDPLHTDIEIRPMLRRRLPLAEDTTQIRHGTATTPLTPVERAVLAMLLDRDASTLGALVADLPHLSEREVREAVSSLARASIVLLSDTST